MTRWLSANTPCNKVGFQLVQQKIQQIHHHLGQIPPSFVLYNCFLVHCRIVQSVLMSRHSRPHPRTSSLTCCCMLIVIFLVASFNGKLVVQTKIPQLLGQLSQTSSIAVGYGIAGHGLTRATQPTPQSTTCCSTASEPIRSYAIS